MARAQSGLVDLEPLDPFHDIDPLLEMPIVMEPAEVNAAAYSSDDDLWEDDDGNLLDHCVIEDDEDEHNEDEEHEDNVWCIVV